MFLLLFCLWELHPGRCGETPTVDEFSKLVTVPQSNQNPQRYLGEQFCEQN